MNRREYLKTITATACAAATGAFPARAVELPPSAAPGAEAPMPAGKIGKLQLSRLLLGSNLLTQFIHAREMHYVNRLAAHYNTEAKIIETLALAERHGINTILMHNDQRFMPVLRRYREREGGKIQLVISPDSPFTLPSHLEQVRRLADDGVDAIYLHGVHADALIARDQAARIGEAVEAIRQTGLPAGVAAHDLRVVTACEKLGVANDFYVKTFHHHNYPGAPRPEDLRNPSSEIPGYWCKDPKDTIAVMKNVTKPWIAFKIMAAGAIPPRDAFPYAFQSGADHILVGMFDFEIAENAATVRSALATLQRARPWCS